MTNSYIYVHIIQGCVCAEKLQCAEKRSIISQQVHITVWCCCCYSHHPHSLFFCGLIHHQQQAETAAANEYDGAVMMVHSLQIHSHTHVLRMHIPSARIKFNSSNIKSPQIKSI